MDRAIVFAVKAHHNTERRGKGFPYIIHPLAVAEILSDYTVDVDTIIGGLLHDCIEDTDMDYAQIRSQFGERVADLVEGVTKLTRLPHATQEEEESENIRKMFLAMAHSHVKLSLSPLKVLSVDIALKKVS